MIKLNTESAIEADRDDFLHNIGEIMYESFVAMHNIRVFGDRIFYRRLK